MTEAATTGDKIIGKSDELLPEFLLGVSTASADPEDPEGPGKVLSARAEKDWLGYLCELQTGGHGGSVARGGFAVSSGETPMSELEAIDLAYRTLSRLDRASRLRAIRYLSARIEQEEQDQ